MTQIISRQQFLVNVEVYLKWFYRSLAHADIEWKTDMKRKKKKKIS